MLRFCCNIEEIMTQTLIKSNNRNQSIDDYYIKYFKKKDKFRPVVLDYLIRNITFVAYNEKIRVITISECAQISKATKVPKLLVQKFISRFLVDLIYIRKFFKENLKIFNYKHQDLKIRVILHKIHRLAPVFDYKRARENAKRLQIKLNQLCFRPHIMTQVAVVIFITDLLDKQSSRFHNKIIQSNLRSLCNCSAYAFHRTRNKIGLTRNYLKKMIKS